MSDLSGEAREALEAARAAEPRPTSGDKARVRALIAASIAAPIAVDPTPAAASTSIGIKTIAGAVLAIGIAGTAILATRPDPPAPLAPAPVKQRVEKPVFVAEPPKPIEPAKPTAPKIEAPSPDSLLAKEAALISAAKAALRAGDRDAALAKVRAHETEFPDGKLRMERTAVEAMATCNADLLPADSPYRAAVDATCK